MITLRIRDYFVPTPNRSYDFCDYAGISEIHTGWFSDGGESAWRILHVCSDFLLCDPLFWQWSRFPQLPAFPWGGIGRTPNTDGVLRPVVSKESTTSRCRAVRASTVPNGRIKERHGSRWT